MSAILNLLKPTAAILICLLICSAYCNEVYKALCTPSFLQIKELIKFAFNKNIERYNFSLEFSSWTIELELRSFCKSNGFHNQFLPERIKVSKLPKMLSADQDQVDILLTIKVPISRFYVDDNGKTDYKYWLMHRWPIEPFFCSVCSAFLIYSTEKNSSVPNRFQFIYGMMQNRFPSIVNPESLEAIRRENKKEFHREEFNFRLGTVSYYTKRKKILKARTVKKTIYVNLSSLAAPNKYFLVGMNIRDPSSVLGFSQNRPQNLTSVQELRRSKRNLNTEPLLINEDEFYLEYSLCYHMVANSYQPNMNCYPLFVDDKAKLANFGLTVADCVCWNPHALKSVIFYQVILLFVIAFLWLIFCNKFRKNFVLRKNLKHSRYTYVHTPNQLINNRLRVVIYQVLLQIHNPENNSSKLPGRLTIKLFGNTNQRFYEISFTGENLFTRPFLFSEDILQSTSYITSDILIWDLTKLVIEFEAINETDKFLYLYGIVVTNGFHQTYTFPYSNYLKSQTEVHLCERSVWLNYMSRHENLIPLSDILPICNPRYIRLSQVEKLMIFIIFVSKFAIASLHRNENEDVNWLFQFIVEMLSSIVLYTLLFLFHIFYAKPSLIREFFFIKLQFEYLEFKFVRFFIFLIVINSLYSSIYDVRNNFSKNELTIYSLINHEETFLLNDLFWACHFMSSIVVFWLCTYLIESYFYYVRKKKNITPGPSNALSDRLVNSN